MVNAAVFPVSRCGQRNARRAPNLSDRDLYLFLRKTDWGGLCKVLMRMQKLRFFRRLSSGLASTRYLSKKR